MVITLKYFSEGREYPLVLGKKADQRERICQEKMGWEWVGNVVQDHSVIIY